MLLKVDRLKPVVLNPGMENQDLYWSYMHRKAQPSSSQNAAPSRFEPVHHTVRGSLFSPNLSRSMLT